MERGNPTVQGFRSSFRDWQPSVPISGAKSARWHSRTPSPVKATLPIVAAILAGEAQDEHTAAMERYKSEIETWRTSCTINDFELSRLEKLWWAGSWRAERSHPAQWGPKGQINFFGHLSLDMVPATMTDDEAIEGEVSAAPAVED